MRYLHLAPGVSYGLVGDKAVFLDLRRDRYLSLDPRSEDLFRALRAAPEPCVPAVPDRDHLLATGLFREASLRGRLAPAHAPAPPASLLDEARARSGWTAPLHVWAALARAQKRLAARPLHALVEAIRDERHAAPQAGTADAAEARARLFLAARALVPRAPRCLPDALALLDWLGDDAGHARLVFGVRLDPFGAHCWLQTERLLLTDARDTVAPFVPVMAV